MHLFLKIMASLKSLLNNMGLLNSRSIRVAKIINDLPDRSVTFWDDKNQAFVVPPGETVQSLPAFHPQVLFNLKEIGPKTIRNFEVQGDENICSFAVVDRVGIISALGLNSEDYNIYDKAYTYLSWDKIKPGHTISLSVITDKEDVVWVVGDLVDDA